MQIISIRTARDLQAAFELGQRDFAEVELAQADLSGLNLPGINLCGANLQGANLTATNLEKSDLSDANLQGANLTQTNLQRSNLSGSNLQQAKLDRTNLQGATLSRSNLQHQDLRTAQLMRADLQGANLQQTNWTGADLRHIKLDAANLQFAILTGANLSYAYMVYAQLAQADLRQADLTNAELTGATLEGGKLDRAKLGRARVRYANLQRASLQQTYLRRCSLQKANLTSADLQRADLTEAELAGAILTQADLRGAILEGAKDADLSTAILENLKSQSQCVLHLRIDALKEPGYLHFSPSLAFSPDGTMLAYTQARYRVLLVNVESGELLHDFKIDPELVVSVVFSADGKQFYDSAYANELKRWNPLTGQSIDDLKDHSAHVSAIALKPDGELVGVMGVGETAEKINLGHETRTFWRYSQEIQTEAESPNGKLVARNHLNRSDRSVEKAVLRKQQIKLFDRQSGKCLRCLDGHKTAVQSLAFHPNSQILASKSMDICRLWNANTGTEIDRFCPQPPYDQPAIAFVRDDRNAPRLVTSVLYAEFSSHTATTHPSSQVTTWRDGSSSSSFGRTIVSANGAVLARHYDGQLVQLWHIKTGQAAGEIDVYPSDGCLLIAIAPTGEAIATAHQSTISLWDVATQAAIATIEVSELGGINAAFSPCGKQLAFGGVGGAIQFWNWQTGEVIQLSGYSDTSAIAFQPHTPTPMLVAGYSDGTIKFWDLQTGQDILSFVAHQEAVSGLVFSPDGKRLASSSRRSEVRIWQVKDF